MEPTIQNRDFLFNGSPTLVNPFISKLIVKLRSPNTSDEFCLAYFVSLIQIQNNIVGFHLMIETE